MQKMDYEIVSGAWLKEQLKQNKLSQRDFIKVFPVLETTLSRWLSDKQKMDNITKYALLCHFRCLELEKELKR